MPVTQSREKYTYFKYLASSACGLIFGIALEKGRVFEPIVIREQMLMTNFTMLKMFLSASATGMLSFSVLTMIPATSKAMESALFEFTSALGFKRAVSAALGGILLGTGMTLSGACPGMVWIQVGAAVPNAVFTLLGLACGVFAYSLSECSLHCKLDGKSEAKCHTLDEYLETPYFILALPMAALLGTAVFALEVIFPWYTQVEVYGSGLFGIRAWPPYVAGTLIGLLQIPTVLILKDTLGTGTGMMTMASQVLRVGGSKVFSPLKRFQSGLTNWWQVFYLGGAVTGAYLSSYASNTGSSVAGIHPGFGFVGGFLMIYGSRLAGGCTSGHGLSGMGLMALLSFVAVPAMFGSGIVSAFFLKYALGVNIDHL